LVLGGEAWKRELGGGVAMADGGVEGQCRLYSFLCE
jgi:hypothetical protein